MLVTYVALADGSSALHNISTVLLGFFNFSPETWAHIHISLHLFILKCKLQGFIYKICVSSAMCLI